MSRRGGPSLAAVQVASGRPRPLRLVIHGPKGSGKTTTAEQFPAPVWIEPESGDWSGTHVRLPAGNWHELRAWLEWLAGSPEAAQTGWKTLVIDTLDWMEPWVEVGTGETTEELYKLKRYDRIWTKTGPLWRDFLRLLDYVQQARGLHVVLLAHTTTRERKTPSGDRWDYYTLALQPDASDLVQQWADAVLFAHVVEWTAKKGKRTVGCSDGRHMLRCTRSATVDAKNRYGLPDEMALDFGALWEGYQKGVAKDPTLERRVREALMQLPALQRDKGLRWLEEGQPAVRLRSMLNRIRVEWQVDDEDTPEGDGQTDTPLNGAEEGATAPAAAAGADDKPPTTAAPDSPADVGAPENWEVCIHDVLRSDCGTCKASPEASADVPRLHPEIGMPQRVKPQAGQ